MPTRRALLAQAALLPALALARPARAAEPEIFARDGIALGGADPVGYFTGGGPVAGSAAEALMWRGAVWMFASARNRMAFEMDPTSYCPRFGGYCAWAMARGNLEPTVPEAWTIHQGRLYLNSSLEIRSRWQGDIPAVIARAEANWPGVLG
ncbi:MAG: YHS domain protein [Paracoccaceae bacterium]|nr:YHS domain protein [Paracoccaceae bacterium]